MAGEDDRQALLPLGLQPLRQPGHTFGVQPLLRLIQDQQLARADERRGQCQPASLTRGQGAWQLAGLRNQLDLLQHLIDHLVRFGDPVRSGQQIQMLDHAQVRKEVKIIDHRGNVAPDLRRGLRHGVAADLRRCHRLARSAPTRQRSRVDLPAPLRPVSAIASPVRTSRLNLSKMVFGPNARRRPDTLRIVVRLAMEAILPLPGNRSGRISHPLYGDEPGDDIERVQSTDFARHQSRVLAATNPSETGESLSPKTTVGEAPMTTASPLSPACCRRTPEHSATGRESVDLVNVSSVPPASEGSVLPIRAASRGVLVVARPRQRILSS